MKTLNKAVLLATGFLVLSAQANDRLPTTTENCPVIEEAVYDCVRFSENDPSRVFLFDTIWSSEEHENSLGKFVSYNESSTRFQAVDVGASHYYTQRTAGGRLRTNKVAVCVKQEGSRRRPEALHFYNVKMDNDGFPQRDSNDQIILEDFVGHIITKHKKMLQQLEFDQNGNKVYTVCMKNAFSTKVWKERNKESQ